MLRDHCPDTEASEATITRAIQKANCSRRSAEGAGKHRLFDAKFTDVKEVLEYINKTATEHDIPPDRILNMDACIAGGGETKRHVLASKGLNRVKTMDK